MHLRLFTIYRIMGQLLPIYPVYLLLFQQKGLSLSAISALLIIWSLPGLLLEVPSSILADRWNRRNLMVAGTLLKALCFLLWCFSGSFSGFAAGFLLWGIGGALCSGTEEAWLYDALKADGKESEFDRIWGESTFYYQMSVGIAFIIGSIIAAHSMQTALWISVIFTAASAFTAAFLPEYNFHRTSKEYHGFKDYIATLKDGISFCWKHPTVSILTGLNVTVLVTAGVLDEYDQLIVRSMGVPFALVGLWGFFRYGMEALGGKYAWKLKRLLSRCGVKKPIPAQFSIAMFAGILLAFVAGFPLAIMLPVYVAYYFLLAAGKVLFTDTLQSEVVNQGRATVQSLTAMLEAPSGILIYSLFGITSSFGQLQGSMLAVAVWIAVFCAVLWIMYAKQKGRVKNEIL